MTQITQNFSLRELCRSGTAARLGIPNRPDDDHFANICRLCENVLQPLRDELGRPLTVNSCYRGPRLNRAVGGSSKSAHMSGRAADIESFGLWNLELASMIFDLDLPVDKVILEFPDPTGEDENAGWVHVQIPWANRDPRYQRLVAYNHPVTNRTTYAFIEAFTEDGLYAFYQEQGVIE